MEAADDFSKSLEYSIDCLARKRESSAEIDRASATLATVADVEKLTGVAAATSGGGLTIDQMLRDFIISKMGSSSDRLTDRCGSHDSVKKSAKHKKKKKHKSGSKHKSSKHRHRHHDRDKKTDSKSRSQDVCLENTGNCDNFATDISIACENNVSLNTISCDRITDRSMFSVNVDSVSAENVPPSINGGSEMLKTEKCGKRDRSSHKKSSSDINSSSCNGGEAVDTSIAKQGGHSAVSGEAKNGNVDTFWRKVDQSLDKVSDKDKIKGKKQPIDSNSPICINDEKQKSHRVHHSTRDRSYSSLSSGDVCLEKSKENLGKHERKSGCKNTQEHHQRNHDDSRHDGHKRESNTTRDSVKDKKGHLAQSYDVIEVKQSPKKSVPRNKGRKMRESSVIQVSDDDADIITEEMIEKLHKRLTTSIKKSKELKAKQEMMSANSHLPVVLTLDDDDSDCNLVGSVDTALTIAEETLVKGNDHDDIAGNPECKTDAILTDIPMPASLPPVLLPTQAPTKGELHDIVQADNAKLSSKHVVIGKKAGLKFGLKITESSAALISMGFTNSAECNPKVQTGEVTADSKLVVSGDNLDDTGTVVGSYSVDKGNNVNEVSQQSASLNSAHVTKCDEKRQQVDNAVLDSSRHCHELSSKRKRSRSRSSSPSKKHKSSKAVRESAKGYLDDRDRERRTKAHDSELKPSQARTIGERLKDDSNSHSQRSRERNTSSRNRERSKSRERRTRKLKSKSPSPHSHRSKLQQADQTERSDSWKRRKSRSRSPVSSNRVSSSRTTGSKRSTSGSKRSRSRSRSHSPVSRSHQSKSRNDRYSSRLSKSRRTRSRTRSGSRCKRSSSRERRSYRTRSRSKSVDESRRVKTSQSSSPSNNRLNIDKAKLREIALKNVYIAGMQAGLAAPVELKLKPAEGTATKPSGKSVQELTEFCKKISEQESMTGKVAPAVDTDHSTANDDDEGSDAVFSNTGLRALTTSAIVMNIRNSKQLPIMTAQEKAAKAVVLRVQFPVSSGTDHRSKESEWVPVAKSDEPCSTSSSNDDKIFVEQPSNPDEVALLVDERVTALRKLKVNPRDKEALGTVFKVQQQMKHWSEVDGLQPGQFTGSTGVQTLTPQQLANDDPRFQAWVKKDTFIKAPPVTGGIGKRLMEKMGWKAGTGLGKNNEGITVPLPVEIKVNRKGLTSVGEAHKPSNPYAGGSSSSSSGDFSGKHPVSALNELCTKRHWPQPVFNVVDETGPSHMKMFRFKVVVNNVEYQPAVGCNNKKMAKVQAAQLCLQELGLIHRT